MPSKPKITQLSIVVVAQNHNPTVLNPDFLKSNEIVPRDWELDGNPVCVEMIAQVNFKNGVKITSQPDRIIFFQGVNDPELKDVEIPRIAADYVSLIRHVRYTAVGVNPRAEIGCSGSDEASAFIAHTLLGDRPWLKFGEKPARAALKVGLRLKGFHITIDVAEGSRAGIRGVEHHVAFEGNVHHEIPQVNSDERDVCLAEVFRGWQSDVSLFMEAIEQGLLKG
jgi:hypothetical protein